MDEGDKWHPIGPRLHPTVPVDVIVFKSRAVQAAAGRAHINVSLGNAREAEGCLVPMCWMVGLEGNVGLGNGPGGQALLLQE